MHYYCPYRCGIVDVKAVAISTYSMLLLIVSIVKVLLRPSNEHQRPVLNERVENGSHTTSGQSKPCNVPL
jgi:hypothetical protein